ncbi:M15 family metallopeptidase [Micromonospora sp. NPDC092111]|uniref:M15 family metallopeptidase n=1 Tax=Micromonospora sp. NPDC092111 TaxID=3364289 RepID=UPI0038013833
MKQQPERPPRPRRRATALAVAATALLATTGCAGGLQVGPGGATAGGTGTTAADGHIADGQSISPFDADHPAIANLDVALRVAIQRAATDARADGVTMVINSGWRSRRYQQELLDRAITTYGSEAEARNWVSPPDRSAHVTGKAIDVGPTDADSWLSQHGADYGLCQTYANEMWHYQLSVRPGGTCPQQISDASAG